MIFCRYAAFAGRSADRSCGMTHPIPAVILNRKAVKDL